MTDTPKLGTLASRITWLREYREMTSAELCRAAKLSQPSLWALETGKTKSIKADTLFKLAAALRANPMWIKDGSGDPFVITAAEPNEAHKLFDRLSPEKQAMILAAIKAII